MSARAFATSRLGAFLIYLVLGLIIHLIWNGIADRSWAIDIHDFVQVFLIAAIAPFFMYNKQGQS